MQIRGFYTWRKEQVPQNCKSYSRKPFDILKLQHSARRVTGIGKKGTVEENESSKT